MKKFICLLLISISVSWISFSQAESDTTSESDSVFQELGPILDSQSQVCGEIIGLELMAYCWINAEVKYLTTYAACGGVFRLSGDELSEERKALDGRLDLACSSFSPGQKEFDKAQTPAQIQALMTPLFRCFQPILSESSKEYGCYVLNDNQKKRYTDWIVKQDKSSLIGGE